MGGNSLGEPPEQGADRRQEQKTFYGAHNAKAWQETMELRTFISHFSLKQHLVKCLRCRIPQLKDFNMLWLLEMGHQQSRRWCQQHWVWHTRKGYDLRGGRLKNGTSGYLRHKKITKKRTILCVHKWCSLHWKISSKSSGHIWFVLADINTNSFSTTDFMITKAGAQYLRNGVGLNSSVLQAAKYWHSAKQKNRCIALK